MTALSAASRSRNLRQPMFFSRASVSAGLAILGGALLSGVAGCSGGSSAAAPELTKIAGFSSSSLSFTTVVGASSTQSVTVSNQGTGPITLGAITLSGTNASLFSQTNGCVATIPASGNCSFQVTFSSAAAGTFSASLNVPSDATSGPTSVALSATVTGAPAVSLSSPTLTFATLVAGSVSPVQSVTLTNTGSAPLNLANIAFGGPGVNLFKQTTTCGATVAPAANCLISATFAPKVAGTYAATVTLTDNAASGTQTIPVSAVATPFVITIDTTIPTDWKINNGTMLIDWNSLKANIFGISMVGFGDNLVDINHVSGGQPFGLYMDNTGVGSGPTSATYMNAGTYLDWSFTVASSATNPYTYSEHFVVLPNDPGVHLYFVANHSATDVAGGMGQIQYVFRDSLKEFVNTYTVDGSLTLPGVTNIPLPQSSEMFSTDPGRAVSDATVDLHGFTDIPAGFTRKIYTKYDHTSYEYLHKAHGLYGAKYGVWMVLPSREAQPGGPTKQSLIFTGNLLMMEAWSGHLDNPLSLPAPLGTATTKLFGPYYMHFTPFGQAYNQVGNTLATPDDMYADALQSSASFVPAYDTETQLVNAGYVPSAGRGSVSLQVNGVTGAAKTAWAVLSDPGKNFQVSAAGHQYWADISSSGTATITGVTPGTYRLSVYDLGTWGELRKENIVVTANQVTTVPAVTFVQENFATTAPLFTIGTPDRSAHEFLHGHDAAGRDDKEFYGAFNYWADFQSTQGAIVYNGTSGPAGPATNDPNKWNYSRWGVFNPGLFGGVYNAADDTTDGYTYAIPTYVAALPGASGTNGVTTRTPASTIHFATPASQTGSTALAYVDLSVSVACAENSYIVTLNGKQLIWHFTNASDCAVRSGLSGYTQWFVMQWDASALNPVGQDNVLSLTLSQNAGSSDDAFRLELTNVSADPTTRGWNDYEFLYGNIDIKPNDALPNP